MSMAANYVGIISKKANYVGIISKKANYVGNNQSAQISCDMWTCACLFMFRLCCPLC